jgi:outer membrane protein assembly factor BamE
MTIRFLLTVLTIAALSTGCGLIYKQNVQQGNAIEQDNLDELYVGMNQRQVLFVLGTPSVKDPFNPDRWDYVQTFSRRGGDPVRRTVTLYFEDGMLTEIEGQDNPFQPVGGDTGESEEVVLQGVDEDAEAISERDEEDREFQRDMDVLDQTPDDNPGVPDIDG